MNDYRSIFNSLLAYMPPLLGDEKKKLTLLRKEVINHDFEFFKELFFMDNEKNHLAKNIVNYSFKYILPENTQRFNEFFSEIIQNQSYRKKLKQYAWYVVKSNNISKENLLSLILSDSCHLFDDYRSKYTKIKEENLEYLLNNIDEILSSNLKIEENVLNLYFNCNSACSFNYYNYCKFFQFLIKKVQNNNGFFYVEKICETFQIESDLDYETANVYLRCLKQLINESQEKYNSNQHGQTLKRLNRLKNWYLSSRLEMRDILSKKEDSKSKMASLLLD